MNTQMYNHPATQQNIETLRGRGAHFVGPGAGHLACGEIGPGRLIDTNVILEAAAAILAGDHSLVGKRVLITSGPTREPVDPVRYIGNRSSGKMGRALAIEALHRGAEVTVVTGPTHVALPDAAEVVRVETAEEMLEAVRARFEECDVFIAAAAVADYRPEKSSPEKHKRQGDALELRLVPNPDIAAEMGLRRKAGQVLAGFAAETDNLLEHAQEKLRRKSLDFLLANAVGGEENAIGANASRAWLLDDAGAVAELGLISKELIAHTLFARVAERLAKLERTQALQR
jgi:phosphopantothenoylcysteine decarboxylase/phosphopantothenate--cysteine ligase